MKLPYEEARLVGNSGGYILRYGVLSTCLFSLNPPSCPCAFWKGILVSNVMSLGHFSFVQAGSCAQCGMVSTLMFVMMTAVMVGPESTC
jgi:Na+/glutamate symporter